MLLRPLLCSFTLLIATLPCPARAQREATYGLDTSTPHAGNPDSTQPTEIRGDVLLARGSYAEALATFQQVEPRTAVIWNKIGIAYHHLFALDQALSAYQKAVALDPHYSEVFNNMGAVYYGKRDFAAAERAYKRSLKYHPRAASTYSNLGTLYFAEMKYKKGVKAYQQAYQIDAEVFNHARRQTIEEPATREQRMATDFYMAEMYASAGKQDEALACLRKALGAGFNDRKRLKEDRELASVRGLPEFHQMMLDDHLE